MNIGLKIKELRKEKGLNQIQFSTIIGIDNSQLSKIERGNLQPTITQLMEISSKFNISIDSLLSNDKNNVKQKIKGNNITANVNSEINNYNSAEIQQLISKLEEQNAFLTNQIKEKDTQISNLINLLGKK